MKDSHADTPAVPGRLVALPVNADPRGCLSFLQEGGPKGAVPFGIRRVYWVYDIRGEHMIPGRAVPGCEEMLVALNGSCRVTLDDGRGGVSSYRLTRPGTALVIPGGTWREIDELSTNAVLLVLASSPYEPGNVIRDYSEYLKTKGA